MFPKRNLEVCLSAPVFREYLDVPSNIIYRVMVTSVSMIKRIAGGVPTTQMPHKPIIAVPIETSTPSEPTDFVL